MQTVANGLNFPTDLAWLPDGTMLVAEKRGILKAWRNGAGIVVADLSASTNDYWDRGLLTVAVDPDYAANHFVYLGRVYENNSTGYSGSKTSQLLRITLNGAGTAMVAGSQLVLLGTATPASCKDLPATADCLPADSNTHNVGDLLFAPDGTLYFSHGDGAAFNFADPASLRAQDLDTLSGKVLHIDRNGKGVPGNPFYASGGATNRSKVYAYGLRNPWRLAMHPVSAHPYIADVGSEYFEELDVGTPGANFGWPCYEGERRRDLAELRSGCDPLYRAVSEGRAQVKLPLSGWYHDAGGAAIIGGDFVNGQVYPPSLAGRYLHGDYVGQFVRSLRTDGNDKLAGAPEEFAAGLVGLVAIQQGPDGKLYVVHIADASNNGGTGSISRLDYQDSGQCAQGQFQAEYFKGIALGGAVLLSQCEGSVLDHQWGLASPGPGIDADNFSARFSGRFEFGGGDYLFQTRSDDGVRLFVDGVKIIDGWKPQSATDYQATLRLAAGLHAVVIEYFDSGEDAVLSASWRASSSGNTAPAISIAAPLANGRYVPGSTVSLAGSATDLEDGPIGAAQLQWNIVIQHCADSVCHSHFLQQLPGASGSFVFPDHGQDDYHMDVNLVATDSGGAQGSATVRLFPDRATGACAASQFKGEYFNNRTLAGAPAATVCSATVELDAGLAAPAAGVAADNFSARYTSVQAFDAADYQFTVTADDGARLLVDGVVLIDAWIDQPATTYSKSMAMTAGNHTVALEFYDATEDAVARLGWAKRCPAAQFTGQYFNNISLAGAPVATSCGSVINFNLPNGAPLAGVNADRFSARFVAAPVFAAGNYLFSVTADDGVRLYVDDVLVINAWIDQAAATYQRSLPMTAGPHTIRLEYYDATEDAVLKLAWSRQ